MKRREGSLTALLRPVQRLLGQGGHHHGLGQLAGFPGPNTHSPPGGGYDGHKQHGVWQGPNICRDKGVDIIYKSCSNGDFSSHLLVATSARLKRGKDNAMEIPEALCF